MKHITKRKNKTGFSLIEIIVAIAIVAVLSAVVITSLTSYRSKARSSKALASLSSAIPSMISCISNMGVAKVSAPSSSTNICTDTPSYGQWPSSVGDLSTYTSWEGNVTSSSNWFVSLASSGSGSDDKKICCSSKMNSCKILDTAATGCDASTE